VQPQQAAGEDVADLAKVGWEVGVGRRAGRQGFDWHAPNPA
jgi:hypothetical protein